MGGIGKTNLAARLAPELAPAFEAIYWPLSAQRPTRPGVAGWRRSASCPTSSSYAPAESERMLALLQGCCALGAACSWLDNVERCSSRCNKEGRSAQSWLATVACSRRWAKPATRAVLLLTSREAAAGVGRARGAVRSLQLGGLGVDEAQALLLKAARGPPARSGRSCA